MYSGDIALSKTSPGSYVSAVETFENTVANGKIAPHQEFLHFSVFSTFFWRIFCHSHQIQNCHSQTLSFWEGLKFVVWETVKYSHKRPEGIQLETSGSW